MYTSSFILEVFVLGLVLSADSFSAAVAMGSRKFTTRSMLKFAIASGASELLAVIAGYFAGAKIISLISAYDHWIAFTLLGAISLHLLYEGIQGLRGIGGDSDEEKELEHGFLKIMLVAVATSMDAFGVGIGLGLAQKPLVPFAISIGTWAFVATVIGVDIGGRASKKLGPVFTLIAGVVLGILAYQMLSI